MFRPALFAPCLVAAACGLVLIAPLAGCGGTKKKGGQTIAEQLARARTDKTPGGVARELAKVARAQLKSGDRTGAVKTLAEARATIADDADAAIFAPRLTDIATVYATTGERNSAREAIDTALAMAERLGDPVARVNVLAKIGTVYASKDAGLGETSKAKGVLKQAADLAAGADVSDRFRPQALAAVAIGYADANLAADAQTVIESLESLADGLQDLRPKAEALAAAATVRARSGASDRSAALLAEAAKAARTIEGAANKTFALLAVAKAMKAAGDPKGASGLVTEAEKSAARIGDPEQQKEALQEIRRQQGQRIP
ncbi:MAG: hypothetical protein ACKO4T_03135 [Planctomycetaceae bacterium]